MSSRPIFRARLALLTLVTLTAVLAGPAAADTSRVGDTQLSLGNQAHRFPDVTYDSRNGVYLLVWGLKPINGRFIGSDGIPIGNTFQISQFGTDPQTPRVAYSHEADAFLVTWINENPYRVIGRLLRYNGGQPQFLDNTNTGNSDEFQIATAPIVHTESAPDIGYSSTSQEFFVTWVEFDIAISPRPNVAGQRLSTSGGLLGGKLPITTSDNWEGFPEVEYNSTQNEYFVVFFDETPDGSTRMISGQRIDSTGTLIGGKSNIQTGPESYPSVAYDSNRNQYLVISFHSDQNGQEVFGRLVDGNGLAIGGPLQLTNTPAFEGGDGMGVAFNALADAYFAVFQYSAPGNDEAWGVEISGTGVPAATMQISFTGTPLAHQPRIAADTSSGRFLAVTGLFFASIGTQLLEVAGAAGGGPDVFTYDQDSGAWIHVDANEQTATGTWSTGWEIDAADFNGDGRIDLLLYEPLGGAWYKAINRGLGTFDFFGGNWGPGWTADIGDFDGDGRSDVFLYNPQTGQWFRGVNIGDGTGDFTFINGLWSPGWSIQRLDLTFDGLTDLFLYNPKTGSWFRAHTTTNGFDYVGGQWSPGWTIHPGDFNGDGVEGLFLYNPAGVWFVATNAGPGFTFTSGTWSPGWEIDVGDLNSDSRDDLFLYNPDSGYWFEAFSDGAGRFTFAGGTWEPGWEFHVMDMNTDSRADLLIYEPSTGDWVEAINVGMATFEVESGTWSPGLTIVDTDIDDN